MEINIEAKVKSWLEGQYDEATKQEIVKMQQEKPEEVNAIFLDWLNRRFPR